MKLNRTMFFLIAISCLAASPASAQANDGKVPNWTSGMANGRFWMGVSESCRLGLVMGMFEGLINASPDEDRPYYASNLSYGEMMDAITRFYDESENAPIPVLWARAYIVSKSRGAKSQELADYLQSLRQATTELLNGKQRPADKPKLKFE
jgi:hypothetical protein